MHEQAGYQEYIAQEQAHQPLLPLQQDHQPFPSFDTRSLPVMQEQDIPLAWNSTDPLRVDMAQLQVTEEPAAQDIIPLTYSEPESTPTTEPLAPTGEVVFSQAMHKRQRRSREKPAEVSLEEVPLLNSRDQYVRELWQLDRPSPEEEQQMVDRARTGDKQAKQALVENSLWYIMQIAKRYSVYVEHDDLLDIVQVGNLAVTEKVDHALENADSVHAYLRGVAKHAIIQYCLYHSRLMPIKGHKGVVAEAPQTISLEQLAEESGNRDTLPMAEPEQRHEETEQEKLHLVRQALSQLTKKQREVIELRYGFGESTLPRIQDLAEHFALQPEAIEYRHIRALKRLRAFFSL